MEELYGGERFTEEHLVTSAVLYTQGRIPPLHNFIVPYSSHHPRLQSHSNFFMWPFITCYRIYQYIINMLGNDAINHINAFIKSISPVFACFVVMSILATWIVLGYDSFLSMAPSLIWCFSLTSMVLLSAKIIVNLNKLEAFKMWSEVFANYCPMLDVHLAEFRFRKLCWKPYFGMWFSFCIYLGCLPHINNSLVIYTYPTMLLCTFVTFFSLSDRLSLWKFVALLVYCLAVVPAAHDAIKDWLIHYSSGSNFDFLLEDGEFTILGFLQLHYGLAPLLHIIWILIVIAGSITKGLSSVVSHIINVAWCHLTVIATRNVVSPAELVYPAIAWSTLALVPLASSAVSLVGPGVLVSACCLQVGATLWSSLSALLLVSSFILTLRRFWPEGLGIFKSLMMISCVIYLAQPLYNQKVPLKTPSTLKWESFQKVCFPTEDTTLATSIESCQHFSGVNVRWQGKVSEVNIKSIDNWPKKLTSYLPHSLKNSIRCVLGTTLPSCYKDKLTDPEFQKCLLLRSVVGPDYCSLHDWNMYNFEVSVTMNNNFWKFSGKEVHQITLTGGNEFKEFLLGLQLGDNIEFIAILENNLGTKRPELSLSSIVCINCKNRLIPIELTSKSMIIDIHRSFKDIFNFFFSPLLSI